MKLLSSDLSRLLELIPVDTNMALERQEYNRRFINDVIHAELFNKAFYDFRISINDDDESMATISQLLTPFWQYGMNKSPLLDRKIIQFLHRGKLVSYDLEPFNQEDWTILHSGIGRLPNKYDRLAEIIDSKKMIAKLDKMKDGLAHFVSKMPPQQLYITKLLQYLKDKA
jgi:tryptophan halogenase